MIIYVIFIVFFAGLAIYAFISRKKYNDDIENKILNLQDIHIKLLNENNNLKTTNTNLYTANANLYNEKETLENEVSILIKDKKDLNDNLISLNEQKRVLQIETQTLESQAAQAQASLMASQSAAKVQAATQEELTKKAFTSYCETLESAYSKAESEYDLKKQSLIQAVNQEQKKLDEISATRAAAHEAILKEQEVKNNKYNYCLTPSSNDLEDIHELERVKNSLHKPRILSMLIWQTYWQPLAKTQFPKILKEKTKCGIYKITNTWTDECYIGQSIDIYKRWCEHCKCGLGIDSPPGNKLYKAIQEYGLETFTFELLAECNKEELNAKEKYFIELYQAKEYGYNGTGGNK